MASQAEPQARTRIAVQAVSKVFSDQPQKALAMLEAGETKDVILERLGTVVGLNRVSFDVAEGEILVVMGLSGSGKSTMLRCINRLVEPSAGAIVVDGTDVTRLNQKDLLEFRRHKFGMVFQHFALFPNRTIQGNVEYGLEIQNVPKAQRAEKALAAIEVVGLKGWEAKYPNQLSGGMQQRAGLARALAVDADILLMDEAFSALDPLIRRDMQGELRQLQRKLGKTIVFVSHDLDEAIALGGRIVLMKDGAIVQIGNPEEILLAPATDYVRRFVEHIDVSSVLTAERLADRGIAVLRTGHTAAEARLAIASCQQTSWYVTDEGGRLVGRATREQVERCTGTIGAVMETGCDRVEASATLRQAFARLAANRDGVAVVDDRGHLIGTVTHRGAARALARDTAGTAAASAEEARHGLVHPKISA